MMLRSAPMVSLAHRAIVAALCLAIAACGGGGDDAPADAQPDAPDASDAAADTTPPPRDAGPTCAPACAFNELCCETAEGPACVDPNRTFDHCGACGSSCEGRGTECEFGTCHCGVFDTGCAGDETGACCPPRTGLGDVYCANFLSSGSDCGGCGVECAPERADRCAAGTCACGARTREQCTGAPDSICCPDITGTTASCVDTVSDRLNCGGCGERCDTLESCVGGTCTVGAGECAGGCVDGEICCRGACCLRVLCDRDACGPGLDGGVLDAGAADAGAADAGALDAGALDAGAMDGAGGAG